MNKLIFGVAVWASFLAARATEPAATVTVGVEFGVTNGIVKPVNGVGQPPILGWNNFSMFHYLKEIGVPYSRLHDVGGAFGKNVYVDIPNLFRDFDADENDPANYDFAFTDQLMKALVENGIEPYFRLGVTIENQFMVRAYRIHPPKDFAKWARICEHIIRHYNEGWANGFHYGITYWEIWNEPETCEFPAVNEMWTGTPEQYYELYDLTAKHLKQCFGDSIKVGGYASTSFRAIYYEPELYGMDLAREEMDRSYHVAKYRMDFFLGFMEYIRAHASPLDFFSWHSYVDVEKTCAYARFLHKTLKEYGYGNAETHLNEWNNAFDRLLIGTSYASAQAAAMMLAQQNEETSLLCYYDARLQLSSYGGLFNCQTKKPVSTYFAFQAFNELYRLGTQVKCDVNGEGLFAVAAKEEDGAKKAVLISNCGEDQEICLPRLIGFSAYLVDQDHALDLVTVNANRFVLKKDRVLLLTNYTR